MATFPTDLDLHLFPNFSSKSLKPSNRQTSSVGYTMAYPKGTVTKKIFEFGLAYLSNTDKVTLQTFFDTNQGLAFDIAFTSTGDSTTYSVIFDQDELDFVYVKRFPAQYTLKVKVKEV